MIQFNTLSDSLSKLEGADLLHVIGAFDSMIYALHYVDDDAVSPEEIQFALTQLKVVRDSMQDDILKSLHTAKDDNLKQ